MKNELVPVNSNAKLPANYEAAKLAILNCERIDECKDWSDKAQAIASYARQANDKEMEVTAMRIRSRAITRCGELLKEVEKAKPGPKELGMGIHTQLSPGVYKTAEAAGMSKNQAVQAIRVANFAEDNPQGFETLVESPTPPTITALAERGIKKREISPVEEKMAQGIPVYEQMGVTKKAFQAATHGGGAIRYFALEMAKYNPQDIVDGSDCEEKEELRKNIHTIDSYLDKIIAKL